jgi:hypothetical protein
VLWVELLLTHSDRERLGDAIVGLPPPVLARARATLFLVLAPWRYMVLLGPRGYRRALMDAGALLRACRSLAGEHGLRAESTLDFYDHRVDEVLSLDGVERTVVAVVAVCDPRDGTS